MLFELEIPDKPIKDSSFNQCLWQLKKDGNGIMGKFTELLTNSDNWKSSICTMEWKAEYVKKNRFIFFLHTNHSDYLLRTPTCEGDAGKRGLGNMTCEEAKEKNRTITLSRQIKDWSRGNGLLPTPTVMDSSKDGDMNWFRIKKMGFSHPSIDDWNIIKAHLKDWEKWEFQMTFQEDLQWKGMLPTPATRDWKGEGGNGADLNRSVGTGTGSSFQLNPKFVLEMMGFPTDFTEKPFNNVVV